MLTSMTDSYDAVIVGGGHHATILAPYLARAGMSVAVFEQHSYIGGSAHSIPGPVPGVTQNPCAHWTRFYSHPAYKDFNLKAEGLEYVFPEGNEVMIFDDGSYFVGYSSNKVIDDKGTQEPWAEGVQRTHDNIKAFSKRDADTYMRFRDAYESHVKSAFGKQRFSNPTPWGTPDPLEQLLTIEESMLSLIHI
jgi:beta-carotene ketolase (CrtO type)